MIVNDAPRGPAVHCDFIHKGLFAQFSSLTSTPPELAARCILRAAPLTGGLVLDSFSAMIVARPHHHVHHHHGLTGRGDARVHG